MKQTKIIKQRACMVIFTLGLCLAGLHEMGCSMENNNMIISHKYSLIQVIKLSL